MMMQGDIDSWQDTEAEGQLSSVMFALENLLHHPGDSSLLLKADIQSGGTGGIPLLAKQIMDQRAPREESDEWMEWKDRFPHFRLVGKAAPRWAGKESRQSEDETQVDQVIVEEWSQERVIVGEVARESEVKEALLQGLIREAMAMLRAESVRTPSEDIERQRDAQHLQEALGRYQGVHTNMSHSVPSLQESSRLQSQSHRDAPAPPEHQHSRPSLWGTARPHQPLVEIGDSSTAHQHDHWNEDDGKLLLFSTLSRGGTGNGGGRSGKATLTRSNTGGKIRLGLAMPRAAERSKVLSADVWRRPEGTPVLDAMTAVSFGSRRLKNTAPHKTSLIGNSVGPSHSARVGINRNEFVDPHQLFGALQGRAISVTSRPLSNAVAARARERANELQSSGGSAWKRPSVVRNSTR